MWLKFSSSIGSFGGHEAEAHQTAAACEAHRGFVKAETWFSTSARNQGFVLLFVCAWGGGCMCMCAHVCLCAHTSMHVCLCVAARGQPWASFLVTALPSFLKLSLTEPGTNSLIPPDWLPSESKIILGQPLQDYYRHVCTPKPGFLCGLEDQASVLLPSPTGPSPSAWVSDFSHATGPQTRLLEHRPASKHIY